MVNHWEIGLWKLSAQLTLSTLIGRWIVGDNDWNRAEFRLQAQCIHFGGGSDASSYNAWDNACNITSRSRSTR